MSVAGEQRIAAAFAALAASARALMPYLMGGYPDLDDLAADRRGLRAAAGADMLELGDPVLGSARRRAGDPRRGDRARSPAGATVAARARRRRGAGAAAPGDRDVLRQHRCSPPGVERFARAPRRAPASSGLIVPDLPLEEADAVAHARAGGRHRARPAGRADDARRAPRRDRRARRAASCTSSRSPARPASARSAASSASRCSRAPTPRTRGPGRARLRHLDAGSRPSAAADAGADGVIVGSRLVRAAGEGADGAGAVGRLVGDFAAALA